MCSSLWLEACVLCAQGSLPVALAGIIIGRDVLLVVGACVDRCRKVRYRAPSSEHVEGLASHVSCIGKAWQACQCMQRCWVSCEAACCRSGGGELVGLSSSEQRQACHPQPGQP